MNETDLGTRIRTRREAAKLSQQELAAKLGVDQTKVSQMELGKRGISAVEVPKIAEALGCSVAWLYDQEYEEETPATLLARRYCPDKKLSKQAIKALDDYLGESFQTFMRLMGSMMDRQPERALEVFFGPIGAEQTETRKK